MYYENIKKRFLIQIEYDPLSGYPIGSDVYYICSICDQIIPSIPTDNCSCTCENIFVDIDSGRVSVKDSGKIDVYKLISHVSNNNKMST